MSLSKPIVLNKWQKNAEEEIMCDVASIAAMKRGQIIDYQPRSGAFIPGPPGTGKSFFIDYIVKRIRKEYPELVIHVTASTGAAAARLQDAMTIATWLSVGSESMKLDKFDCILDSIKKNCPDRLNECDILIGDEMSMVSQRQFENLNRICQVVRKNPIEFGGIYPIFTGDPFQLPPIPHDNGYGLGRLKTEFVPSCLERQYPGYYYITPDQLMRAAECPVLQNILMQLISNDSKQRTDAVKVLNEKTCQGEMSIIDALELQQENGSTILCTSKENELSVEHYNQRAVEGFGDDVKEIIIKAPVQLHDSSSIDIITRGLGIKNVYAEETEIKSRNTWPPDNKLIIGVPYMIRANKETPEKVKIYNGMMCQVISYNPNDSTAQVHIYKTKQVVTISPHEFRSEWIPQIGYSALPLIRASAMTVHKSQGATLDSIIFEHRRMYVNENHEYVPHMLYTAFSRVKKIDDIRITDILAPHIIQSKSVQAKLNMIWKLPYMKDYLNPTPLTI